MTMHDHIDEFLAADLHSELSDEERSALHTHLVECADCRQAHQETKIMNKVFDEKFENETPDLAFEHRMLAHFRNRALKKSTGIFPMIMLLLRSRVTQGLATA